MAMWSSIVCSNCVYCLAAEHPLRMTSRNVPIDYIGLVYFLTAGVLVLSDIIRTSCLWNGVNYEDKLIIYHSILLITLSR